jgi:hypothetical protein
MTRARLLVAVAVLAGLFAAGVGAYALAPAMRNQAMYGTVSTEGTPPLIRYCNRTYLPAAAPKSGSQVMELNILERIGTTPAGMPVMADVMSPASRASYHTNVCTMAIWVKTGPDQYLAYGLSGGP